MELLHETYSYTNSNYCI